MTAPRAARPSTRRRGPRPRRREAAGDAPRDLARTPTRPGRSAPGQRNGGRHGRPMIQPHHPLPKAGYGCTCARGSLTGRSTRSPRPTYAAGKPTGAERRTPTVGHCRSLALRIFQYAGRGSDRRQPGPRCHRLKRRVDPEQVFGEVDDAPSPPRRPGGCWPASRCSGGPVPTLLGTGLRFGELAGLRRRRVHLDRPMPVLEVGPTRYRPAGSAAASSPGPRATPASARRPWPHSLSRPSAASSTRSDPEDLVFTGPRWWTRPARRAERAPRHKDRPVPAQPPPHLPGRRGQAGRLGRPASTNRQTRPGPARRWSLDR